MSAFIVSTQTMRNACKALDVERNSSCEQLDDLTRSPRPGLDARGYSRRATTMTIQWIPSTRWADSADGRWRIVRMAGGGYRLCDLDVEDEEGACVVKDFRTIAQAEQHAEDHS